jgi:hypothetical protein
MIRKKYIKWFLIFYSTGSSSLCGLIYGLSWQSNAHLRMCILLLLDWVFCREHRSNCSTVLLSHLFPFSFLWLFYPSLNMTCWCLQLLYKTAYFSFQFFHILLHIFWYSIVMFIYIYAFLYFLASWAFSKYLIYLLFIFFYLKHIFLTIIHPLHLSVSYYLHGIPFSIFTLSTSGEFLIDIDIHFLGEDLTILLRLVLKLWTQVILPHQPPK